MTWVIQGVTGELAGQSILVEQDMLIGRHQTADLILQSAEISRKHAELWIKDTELWIKDLGSSNGTFVNDAQISDESVLKEGDIVRFASLEFVVLKPVQEKETVRLPAGIELQPVVEAVGTEESPVDHQLEQVAEEEQAIQEMMPKTVAEKMNEQGMPELTERDSTVRLTKEGMPQGVAIPKPAPIPEGVDITAVKPEPTPVPVEQPITRVEQEKEAQKNASVGLITVIVLIIVALIAWLLFK